jgi:transcriptional regulator with XRE-family HTH domain
MTIRNKKSEKTIKKLEAIAGEKFSLGSFLAAIRQGEEMTQVEFAKLLSISKQNLCDIEHRRRSVSLKAASGFARKLGYAPDQFIRLALQDIVDREGVHFIVEIKAA